MIGKPKVTVMAGWFPCDLSPCCADRYLLAVSLCGLFSVYAHSWHPFLTRTLVLSDRGPMMWPQLTLIASLNALFPHTVTVRLGLQYMN